MNKLIIPSKTAGVLEQRHPVLIEVWESAERSIAESLPIRHPANGRARESTDTTDPTGAEDMPNRVRYSHD